MLEVESIRVNADQSIPSVVDKSHHFFERRLTDAHEDFPNGHIERGRVRLGLCRLWNEICFSFSKKGSSTCDRKLHDRNANSQLFTLPYFLFTSTIRIPSVRTLIDQPTNRCSIKRERERLTTIRPIVRLSIGQQVNLIVCETTISATFCGWECDILTFFATLVVLSFNRIACQDPQITSRTHRSTQFHPISTLFLFQKVLRSPPCCHSRCVTQSTTAVLIIFKPPPPPSLVRIFCVRACVLVCPGPAVACLRSWSHGNHHLFWVTIRSIRPS